MKDLLAYFVFFVLLISVFSPQHVGSWLAQVHRAYNTEILHGSR